MKKDEISEGLAEAGHAGSSEITQNDAGTCERSDTRLTQWRSPTVRWPMIYFVRAADAIKIGYSENPEARIGMLQVGTQHELELLGVMRGDMEDEGALHERFAHLHIRGEWFRAEPVLLDFIEISAQPLEPRPARTIVPRPAPAPLPPAPPRPPVSAEGREMIAGLINLRSAHGPETATGYACSNLAEQIENMAGYERPEWATHECQTLPWLMKRQTAALARIRSELQ